MLSVVLTVIGFSVALVLSALYFLSGVFQRKYSRNKEGEIVAQIVPGYPLVGNLFELMPSALLTTLHKNSLVYGRNFDMYVFGKRHRVIGDSGTVRELMTKRPKFFRRPRSFEIPFTALGMPTNIFAAEGVIWSRNRRLTAPHFSRQNVLQMTDVIVDETKRFMNKLEVAANGNSVVHMDYSTSNFTTRVIGRVSVGLDPEEPNVYFGSEELVDGIRVFLEYALQRIMFPGPQWLWDLTSYKKLEDEAVALSKRFDQECIAYVDKVRAELANDTSSADGSLIKSYIRESEKMHREDPSAAKATDAELLETVKVMFIAGADTTSVTITWVVYCLIKCPEWAAKLREEVDSVLGGPHRVPQTNEDVSRLVNVTAFVRETLRLFSPAGFFGLETVSDSECYVCHSNGMTIEPSDVVFINVEGSQRDPGVYKDPLEFLPGRWVVDAPAGSKEAADLVVMENHFLTFGAGTRICPGMGLATMESVISTAALVSHFDLDLACPMSEIERVPHFAAKPNKMPVYVHRRRV